MINRIKIFFKQFKWPIIIYSIIFNCLIKFRFLAGLKVSSCGSTTKTMSIDQSVEYINRLFNDYIKFSSLSIESFRNKRILEIGPGDNLGLALKFLSIGASYVTCIDKFYSKRSNFKEIEIYRLLRAQFDDKARKEIDKIINLKDSIKINSSKLKYKYGFGIDKVNEILLKNKFDFIVSNAVLEHIYELDNAFSNMNNLLTPGGYMIHIIDFRDHNIFSDSGKNPFTFLTIPEFIYRLMSKDSGLPNRKLIGYYRKKLNEFNFDFKIIIRMLYGMKNAFEDVKTKVVFKKDYTLKNLDIINEIRRKLFSPFKKITDEDLLVNLICIVAKKRQPI